LHMRLRNQAAVSFEGLASPPAMQRSGFTRHRPPLDSDPSRSPPAR
jgi:hypothetical protein